MTRWVAGWNIRRGPDIRKGGLGNVPVLCGRTEHNVHRPKGLDRTACYSLHVVYPRRSQCRTEFTASGASRWVQITPTSRTVSQRVRPGGVMQPLGTPAVLALTSGTSRGSQKSVESTGGRIMARGGLEPCRGQHELGTNS